MRVFHFCVLATNSKGAGDDDSDGDGDGDNDGRMLHRDMWCTTYNCKFIGKLNNNNKNKTLKHWQKNAKYGR